jgi:hypothetical protein
MGTLKKPGKGRFSSKQGSVPTLQQLQVTPIKLLKMSERKKNTIYENPLQYGKMHVFLQIYIF